MNTERSYANIQDDNIFNHLCRVFALTEYLIRKEFTESNMAAKLKIDKYPRNVDVKRIRSKSRT